MDLRGGAHATPLADALQPEAAFGDRRRIEAGPLVEDDDFQPIVRLVQFHANEVAAAVPAGVRQRFLHDAENPLSNAGQAARSANCGGT